MLVVDNTAGATTAHLSSLMKSAKKSGCIYLFGVRSPEHKSEIQTTLDRLDAGSKLLCSDRK